MCQIIFLLFLTLTNCVLLVVAHGMVLDPVNRGSRWRYDAAAPINYNDNEGFCGGFYNQWFLHKGKCGICGDNYNLTQPRPHEYGGKYGNGTIVKTYKSGDQIPVGVLITANHRGYFVFDICDLDTNNESRDCFERNPLKLSTGENRYKVQTHFRGWFNTTLSIPKDLRCNHCVLRWSYIAGNSWGSCKNGTEALGCGPQENFRTCSDIRILPDDLSDVDESVEVPLDFLIE